MDCVKLVLFCMLYPFLCQLVFSSSLPHLCPKDQAHALLQFRQIFTINTSYYCGPPNPRTLSWNKSTDCCSWDRVQCDETTGQVIELDLACSGLQGKFHSNSSLFQLSSLKKLDLSHNDFSGSLISPKFGELSSLTHLYLSRSSFTGIIPAEISHLSKLQVLHIWTDDPYGLRLGPYNFELLLKNLTQLRELDLYSVNISSPIPLNFSSYLTKLQLSGSQLRGILPERVFHLFNLEYLYLSSNSLTGPIPSNVSGLQNLQRLYLSSNYLNGTIPSSIFSLPSLSLLDLSNNSFSGKIQEFKSKTLVLVSVKQNQLQGPIPKSFQDQHGLIYLILSQNNFSGQIPSTVCNLKALGVLDLGSNHLNGTIPQCLGEMSGLMILGLNNNSLSNNDLNDTFPSWLGGLPDLQILSLRSNKLHGRISDSRTDNLFAKIRVIDLSSNGFSGNLPVSLFENFQAMKIIGENSGTREYIAEDNSGKQFDMFDNSSYQGNDGLRGLPLSKDCGGDDGVPQATTPVELDDDEEEERDLISRQVVLMGFGCGLVIGLSIIYIMLSTHYLVWFSRMVVKFEKRIVTTMERHKKRY
ncbi:putative serine/threonine-protein phosphatase PP2A catalytic subunit-like isoform 1 [Capsicum annuum]|nr:putative serine/threonine-protein phosphatase PP2A catalytic subunit-like isoform 1 [Capsicum annuum]